MRFGMWAAVFSFAAALSGCKGSSSGGSSAASKALFSVWTDTTGFVLDLSAGSLGTNIAFDLLFSGGAVCSCAISMIGTDSAGNYTVSSCTYSGGGSGDPGCSSLSETGSYTNSSAVLTTTTSPGGVVTTYH